ncbi:helix-turn-helix transcriptional regulator [Microbispora sp. KK1-11]|uniref:helix-turn-helix domain-containing protein n=1 Tax=Microbispora sp. KK1-11 TaxID=2053005 RepID=UPI00163C2284|nr:helix-turn-helix transcriptional regulator [Microbispora sp. KK1-11]
MTIRSRRVLNGLMGDRSARAIARAHGCNHQVLSALASGRRASCSRTQAEAIAQALGVEVDDLFMERATKKSFVKEQAA